MSPAADAKPVVAPKVPYESVAAALGRAAVQVDASEGVTTLGTDTIASFEDESRGAHVIKGQVPTDEPRGAHVKKGDPLCSVERRALHAMTAEPLASPEPSPFVPEPGPAVTPNAAVTAVAGTLERKAARAVTRTAARSTNRPGAHASSRRRWGLVPVAGAVAAVAVGLGGGAAYAFFTGGPGRGFAATGTPVTIKAIATTGTADLLPGRAGAVYFTLHNPDSFGATFEQVVPGATVVSDNTDLCPSGYVSIAQTLPYTIPTGVTVSQGGTSGTQSIANLVMLAPNAPSTCQGVTFTVTLTLSGQSS